MVESAAEDKSTPVESVRSTTRVTWLLLGGIIALGALLRGIRLGEAPGGFHVFNENFYLQLAARDATRGALDWFFNPLDLNNPPLFNGLVSTILRLHGPVVASARLASVLSGLAAIAFTFLLGRLLFGERTGLVAAAALAVMPGMVLVNHNIQVDSLFVALTLAGVYFYVRSLGGSKMSDAVVGGVLLGLAMLTKQPAVLALGALAVWRTWAGKGFAWLRERRTWGFAVAAAGVGGSWYLMELLVAPQHLLGSMASVAGNPEMSAVNADFWINTLGSELMWMVFPLAAAVAVLGVAVMARRRESGDMLVLVLLAFYLAWYVGFHKHCYYLLPVAPLMALAIGRACVAAFDRKWPAPGVRAVAIAVLVAAMAFGSVMTMSGQKWGRWSPMDFQPTADAGYQRVRLAYEPDLDGLYYSIEGAVDKKHAATPRPLSDFMKLRDTPGTEDLYLSEHLVDRSGGRVPAREVLSETWVRPVFFGLAVGQHPQTAHGPQVFTNAPWSVAKVGPVWRFGVDSVRTSTNCSVYAKSRLPR